MSSVTALALLNSSLFPRGSEVVRVEYALGKLLVYVRGISDTPSVVVEFEDVIAFRVLNERDLMEFWPECSTPNGWIFQITAGGWLSQEASRPSSLIAAMNPNASEYLVTGEDDCVSVICQNEPVVRENAL